MSKQAVKDEKPINLNAQLASFIKEANDNPKKESALIDFLKQHPDIDKDWRLLGNRVFRELIGQLAGHKPGSERIYTRECQAMQERLGVEEATDLERLAIEYVVLCWLRMTYAETYVVLATKQGISYKQSDFMDRELSRAHSRYVRALESLARLKLLTQATRYAEAKADLAEAKASEVSIRKSQRAVALLKAVNS